MLDDSVFNTGEDSLPEDAHDDITVPLAVVFALTCLVSLGLLGTTIYFRRQRLVSYILLEHAFVIGLIEICHQSWIQRKRKSILFAFYKDWIHTYICCCTVDWFLRIFFSRNEERLRRLEEKNYVSANFITTEQEPHQYSSLQDFSGPPRPLSSEREGTVIHQSWSSPHRSLPK